LRFFGKDKPAHERIAWRPELAVKKKSLSRKAHYQPLTYNGLMSKRLLAFALVVCTVSQLRAAQSSQKDEPLVYENEINSILMESTFRISGPSARPGEEGHGRTGTGFVILRRMNQSSDDGHPVLVTAKHVFEDIKGEIATVDMRKRNIAGDAELLTFRLKIRDGGRDLFTTHPTADVAAIDITPPSDSIISELRSHVATINWLATDTFLADIKIHPGDATEVEVIMRQPQVA